MSSSAKSTMSETDFIRGIVQRTGCGLLLDVNNVFVSATNHGYSALDYLSDFPIEHVGEIHLAGHAEQVDDEGDRLLIDSHDGPVTDAVWKLFEIVVSRSGPIPTLVEWDSNIPDWPVLKAEAGPHRRSWTVTQHPSHPEKSMRVVERIPRHDGGQLSFAVAFSPALLDPQSETPAAVTGPNEKAAVRRYNVYRNNVTVSLIDALAAIFPATQRITGVEFFRAMARFHVRATPPTSPLLFEYGRDFAGFIERYEYARSMPWLADVARIERAWLDAYHAADMETLRPEALASIPPERLPDVFFVPHPATRIVCSEFPAVSIFVPNRSEGPGDPIVPVAPQDALITRPGLEVVVRHLPPGGATFLACLISGQTLGQAVSAAFEASTAFDLPANIAGMIEAGVFTAIDSGDPG
jgi:hypothetical protein